MPARVDSLTSRGASRGGDTTPTALQPLTSRRAQPHDQRQLTDEDHKYHGLLDDVRERVHGACVYCARAYGVKDAIEEAGIPLVDEYQGQPSVRDLMAKGYSVVTL